MIKNAPIVVLDEATSALDNKSEGIVQKALDNLMKNRTVIVIAHRLSTIKNADRIAVLNEGELAELGTHDELMAIENGQYRQLYEMQFQQQKAAGEEGEDTGYVSSEEITEVQENKSTGKESTDGITE
jgi:subfamily B ATP-binding cassette protein MsbA